MESDLEAVIKDRRLHLGPGDIKSYLRMVLLALECCHANWVLHRDMKPNNLLIGPDGTLKLADFGLARIFGSPDRRFTHQVFARWYRAPELLFGAKCYGGGVDVWGVGCVMGELMSRLPMFEGSSDIDQLGKIFAVLGTPTEAGWPGVRALPDFVEYVPCVAPPLRTRFPAASDEAVALLSAMLTYDPNQRLTATSALAHPYFSSGPAATPPHALPRPQRAPGAGGGGGARPAPGGAAGGAAGGPAGAPGGGAEGGGGAGGTKRAAPEGGGASPGTLRALAQRRSFPPPAAPSDGGFDGGAGSQSLPRPPSRVPAGRSRFAPSSAGPRASDASMGATPSSPAPVPMSCLGGTGDSGAPLSGPYLSTGAAAMAGPRHAPDSTDLQVRFAPAFAFAARERAALLVSPGTEMHGFPFFPLACSICASGAWMRSWTRRLMTCTTTTTPPRPSSTTTTRLRPLKTRSSHSAPEHLSAAHDAGRHACNQRSSQHYTRLSRSASLQQGWTTAESRRVLRCAA